MEGIVDLPASANEVSANASASETGASPEKAKDKDKDGQGERQGAGVGVGSKSGDNVGSPNGSGNSSGRKKEVDLVSSFLSLSWVWCLFLVRHASFPIFNPKSPTFEPRVLNLDRRCLAG